MVSVWMLELTGTLTGAEMLVTSISPPVTITPPVSRKMKMAPPGARAVRRSARM